MYAVQNDTEIKFSIVLYVKVIFVGQGVGIQKAYTSPIWWLVNHGNHWRSKRDPRAKQGFGWGK